MSQINDEPRAPKPHRMTTNSPQLYKHTPPLLWYLFPESLKANTHLKTALRMDHLNTAKGSTPVEDIMGNSYIKQLGNLANFWPIPLLPDMFLLMSNRRPERGTK